MVNRPPPIDSKTKANSSGLAFVFSVPCSHFGRYGQASQKRKNRHKGRLVGEISISAISDWAVNSTQFIGRHFIRMHAFGITLCLFCKNFCAFLTKGAGRILAFCAACSAAVAGAEAIAAADAPVSPSERMCDETTRQGDKLQKPLVVPVYRMRPPKVAGGSERPDDRI